MRHKARSHPRPAPGSPLKGGFNAETKTRMVAEATAILGKYSKTDSGQVPAYVGILEVPEENWGMYGQQVHLAAMQIKA